MVVAPPARADRHARSAPRDHPPRPDQHPARRGGDRRHDPRPARTARCPRRAGRGDQDHPDRLDPVPAPHPAGRRVATRRGRLRGRSRPCVRHLPSRVVGVLEPLPMGARSNGGTGLDREPGRGRRHRAPRPPPAQQPCHVRSGCCDLRDRSLDRRQGVSTVVAAARVPGRGGHRSSGDSGLVVPSLRLGRAHDRMACLGPGSPRPRRMVGHRGGGRLLGGPVLVGAPRLRCDLRRPWVVNSPVRLVLRRLDWDPAGHVVAPLSPASETITAAGHDGPTPISGWSGARSRARWRAPRCLFPHEPIQHAPAELLGIASRHTG